MEPNRQPKIFISYRQEDSSDTTNHLHETLSKQFGSENVFMDIRSLEGGDDFPEVIKSNLINSSDVVLVVIGKSWMSSIKEKQAAGQKDYVRYEVATALATHPSGRVMPVLVQGASFPAESDLPPDMSRLVPLYANTLSVRWWPQDVQRLIGNIRKKLGIAEGVEVPETRGKQPSRKPRSNAEISFLGGSFAGLVTGLLLGVAYTLTQPVSWWRFSLVGLYGLVAGALISWSINTGVEKVSRAIGNVLIGKIVGAALGGALSGVVAGVIAGFGFVSLSGNVVESGWVVAAVAVSSFFITAGILLPDLEQDWVERLIVLVVIVATTVPIAFFVSWLLLGESDGGDSFTMNSPFSLGVMVLGSLCGAMAGAQVGLALVIFELRSRRAVETV